jgi:hypothetical protein
MAACGFTFGRTTMTPETYVLRVYRRSGDAPWQIVGRVETPGGQLCAGFTSLVELSAILESPKDYLRRADDLGVPDAVAVKMSPQEGADGQ